MPCGEAPLTVPSASSGRCDLHVFEARPDRWCNSTGARRGSEDTDKTRQTDEQRLDAAKYTIHGWLHVLTKGEGRFFPSLSQVLAQTAEESARVDYVSFFVSPN